MCVCVRAHVRVRTCSCLICVRADELRGRICVSMKRSKRAEVVRDMREPQACVRVCREPGCNCCACAPAAAAGMEPAPMANAASNVGASWRGSMVMCGGGHDECQCDGQSGDVTACVEAPNCISAIKCGKHAIVLPVLAQEWTGKWGTLHLTGRRGGGWLFTVSVKSYLMCG